MGFEVSPVKIQLFTIILATEKKSVHHGETADVLRNNVSLRAMPNHKDEGKNLPPIEPSPPTSVPRPKDLFSA